MFENFLVKAIQISNRGKFLLGAKWFGIEDTGTITDLDDVIAKGITLAKGFVNFSGVVSVVFVIVGGVKWITAGGDQEKLKSAQGTVTAATAGLVVVILARGIVDLVWRQVTQKIAGV